MTISPNVTKSTMQESSLRRDDVKEDLTKEVMINQNAKIESKENTQIKSYNSFLGNNIDIRV